MGCHAILAFPLLLSLLASPPLSAAEGSAVRRFLQGLDLGSLLRTSSHQNGNKEDTSTWRRQLAAEPPGSAGAWPSGTGKGRGQVHSSSYMAALESQASSTHCNITGRCIPCTRDQQDNEAACRATGFHQEVTCIERFGTHPAASQTHPSTGGEDPSNDSGSGGSGSSSEDSAAGKLKAAGADLREEVPAVVKDGGVSGMESGSGGEREGEKEEDAVEDEVALAARSKKTASDRSSQIGRRLHEHDSTIVGAFSKQLRYQARAAAEAEPAITEDGGHHHRFRKYISFESCSPIEEETLSVFGFEAIVLSLLVVCAPVVYQRKRKAVAAIAMTRMPSGSRV